MVDVEQQIFQHARNWILEAGTTIRKKINEPLTINTKSNANDLVTNMDREIEGYFAKKIHDTYPHHHILSEEGYGDTLQTLDGTVWIIDPIDGTMNFVHQKRNFAISIGIYLDGIGKIGLIYDVMADVLYHGIYGQGAFKNDKRLPNLSESITLDVSILAMNHFWLCENPLVNVSAMKDLLHHIRGTRLYGSAALEFCFIAEGIIDGYLKMSLAPWDVAAGMIILSEVGGETTDIFGNTVNLLKRSSIVACNKGIQDQLINDYLYPKKGTPY